MPIGKESEPINIGREIRRFYNSRYNRMGVYQRDAGNNNGLQGARYDPLLLVENKYGYLRTADRYQNRSIGCETLRRVSAKCWIIQACILNVQKKVRPFFKPSTDRNVRGYVVLKKGEDVFKTSGRKSAQRDKIENFLITTGLMEDPDREDTFTKYGAKIIRDLLEIDQIATEIQYNRIKEPCAFWAIDAATIEKVIPGQENPDNIRYVQVIDHIPYAFYSKDELIFDFLNPRTDIKYSFYGYSYVEQAIDLVTSVINAFSYNAGFFTENKLPRGMLLIDGDASQETVQMMEDYLFEILSGSPSNQWRIPIIPSGMKKGETGNKIQFLELHGKNREMEFMQWLDYLNSGVAAIFGATLEDLGIHSQKSQPLYENSREHIIKSTKGLILGDVLSFVQDYINRIIQIFFPDYRIEFVGYEKEDPKETADLDKLEMESFKTLNEKREEKGLKRLDQPWADIPMSSQAVQLYQGAQMGGGMEDMGDMEGFEGMDGEGEGDKAADEEAPDFDGSGGDFGSGDAQKKENYEAVNKALGSRDAVRIVV